eukprot:1056429-Prymnesium_polylepis.1
MSAPAWAADFFCNSRISRTMACPSITSVPSLVRREAALGRRDAPNAVARPVLALTAARSHARRPCVCVFSLGHLHPAIVFHR